AGGGVAGAAADGAAEATGAVDGAARATEGGGAGARGGTGAVSSQANNNSPRLPNTAWRFSRISIPFVEAWADGALALRLYPGNAVNSPGQDGELHRGVAQRGPVELGQVVELAFGHREQPFEIARRLAGGLIAAPLHGLGKASQIEVVVFTSSPRFIQIVRIEAQSRRRRLRGEADYGGI